MDCQVTAEENLPMEASYNSKDPTEKTPAAQKGGLRTLPFIMASQSLHSVASFGVIPNMILYLINGYNMDMATGSSILTMWSALSDYLAIFGAFISDSYLGRFKVVALGTVISLLGMTLLWLTAVVPLAKPPPCNLSHTDCEYAMLPQLALLLSSLAFLSVGAGCVKPCSIAFGADQLIDKDNKEKSKRVLDSYFNWYYACGSLSAAIGMLVIVYIQDHLGMKVGLGVLAVLMLLSASFFVAGSSLYIEVKAQKSLFTGLAQVLVAAFKNRRLAFPLDNSDGFYYHGTDSNFSIPSEKLRFLSKACIIRNPDEDLTYDGSAAKPWELCTVDQVEALKALISILPIWSTGIMIYATVPQSALVLQANSMDRHVTSNFKIPAGSFGFFTAITVTIWVAFYDQVIIPLLAKYRGRPGGINPTLRIGIGLVISCLSMGIAAIVESIRRTKAIQQGLSDDPRSVVRMSAMWLIPQCALNGLAEGFNVVGQLEFYFSHLPKSMSSLAMAFFTLGTAFAGLLATLVINVVNHVTQGEGNISWLSTNLNKGHYDYYYGLLSFLSLLNFLYFLLCCRASGLQEDVRAMVSTATKDLKETLLTKPRESPTGITLL